MAIGAMKALIDMDIYRPVCGFDGVSLMGYAGKQMHTVRQDFQNIAARAVEELSRLMEYCIVSFLASSSLKLPVLTSTCIPSSSASLFIRR